MREVGNVTPLSIFFEICYVPFIYCFVLLVAFKLYAELSMPSTCCFWFAFAFFWNVYFSWAYCCGFSE